MAKHNDLGKAGEAAALALLTEKGYRIRDLNWRTGHLEIDIVAQTANELVFVEVKTRNGPWDAPDLTMSATKIRRLVAAADAYLRQHEEENLLPRFDVVLVRGRQPKQRSATVNFDLRHVEAAFYPPIETYD
jgi:putative endonuclease